MSRYPGQSWQSVPACSWNLLGAVARRVGSDAHDAVLACGYTSQAIMCQERSLELFGSFESFDVRIVLVRTPERSERSEQSVREMLERFLQRFVWRRCLSAELD